MSENPQVLSPPPQISFGWALVPLLLMMLAMGIGVIVLGVDAHLPLVLGTVIAGLVAWRHGFAWDDLEHMMYQGIRLALPAVLIIMLIGMVIGSWIGGGVVATMIYYGLNIISPAFFLAASCLLCAVVALAIGSSWSTMGTVGVACMGIGTALNVPLPMVAGAVVSGAYFGDKMSPLSDTTILASGLTHTDLFEHIRHMVYTTVPGLLIALGVYLYLGRSTGQNADLAEIAATQAGVAQAFTVSPWLLLVPVLLIVLVLRRMPAMPALVVSILVGLACQVVVQGESLTDALSTLQNGYVLESGNETLDNLFTRGGLQGMMYTVSLVLIAMTFGGILEYSGMLRAIVQRILSVARSTGSLIAAAISSAIVINVACAEQYVSLVVPARMYVRGFVERGLAPKNLSRSLEDGGTLTSVLVPWNTCGVFALGALGISAWEYAPYAVLNYVVPIIGILYGLTGSFITYLTDAEVEKYKREFAQDGQSVVL
ncbi:Na+/H+ antiporter NhaC [Deinococcus piscis]|uniref:Na+/H+ antiporter NhaC n=1 Tax=Deinococcus piscis TaxID=394230 RepID=UPI00167371F2|nr:Na+/H+ antiporter NhaC [Deinococcus piscis]